MEAPGIRKWWVHFGFIENGVPEEPREVGKSRERSEGVEWNFICKDEKGEEEEEKYMKEREGRRM